MTNILKQSLPTIASLGAFGCLTGAFYAYAETTAPDFTILENSPKRTHVQYTYPTHYPSILPLETYAVRTFSKHAIGEEIVLSENRPHGETLTLKRLSQSGGLTECASFEVQTNQSPPVKKEICSGRYPTGF